MRGESCPNGSHPICPQGVSPSSRQMSILSAAPRDCVCVPFFLMDLSSADQGPLNRKLSNMLPPLERASSVCNVIKDDVPKHVAKIGRKSCTCSFSFESSCGKVTAAKGSCDKKCGGKSSKIEVEAVSGNHFTFAIVVSKGKVKMSKVAITSRPTTSAKPTLVTRTTEGPTPTETSPATPSAGNGCLCVFQEAPDPGIMMQCKTNYNICKLTPCAKP